MKPTIKLRFFLLACGSLLFAATSSHAAPLYWDGTDTTADADGGDGTWDNVTLNWDDATTGGADTAWVSGETAVFGATAGTVTLGDNVTVGGISFDTGGYTLDPDGAGTFEVTFGTAGDIAVNTGTSTINAAIGGSSKITKTGSGQLNLRGANTFTGGFDINAGTVGVTNSANEGSFFGAASNTVTFTGDSELYNSNGAVTMGQNFAINDAVTGSFTGAFGETTQVDGVLSGSGTLNIVGFSANFSAQFRNTANTFTGDIVANMSDSGNIQFASLLDADATIGLSSNSNNGANFIYAGSDGALVFDNRAFELIGDGNTGTNTGRRASIQNNNGDVNFTMTVNTTLSVVGTGNKIFVLGGGNNGDNAFNGAIQDGIGDDTLTLEKRGAGKWILGGANTYEGNTFVDAGTLELGTSAELLFVIGALSGENNAILGDATNATVNLDGLFRFNLTDAGTDVGLMWDVLDEGNLTETHGTSFAVASTNGAFTDNGGGIWTRDENGTTYSFAQDTGILTVVIPEPASALLGSLGCLLLLRRRRA